MPRRRKARDLKRTPKWAMPQHYREFLQKAMHESRGSSSGSRPSAQFSRPCLRNAHSMCPGYLEIDYSKHATSTEREDCICHCHDSLIE